MSSRRTESCFVCVFFYWLDVQCPERDFTPTHGTATKYIQRNEFERQQDSHNYRNHNLGGFVQYTCNTGYHITGLPRTEETVKVTCKQNGQWSREIPTCSGRCHACLFSNSIIGKTS